jgi:hypothetical protein
VKTPPGYALREAAAKPVQPAKRAPSAAAAAPPSAFDLAAQNAQTAAADSQQQAGRERKSRPKDERPQQEQSVARLELMKETAGRIQIGVEENAGGMLKLEPQPVMRWANHGSFIVDAATFVWLDDHRPQVIGGMWIKNGHAFFDLQSLSARPLSAKVDGTARWSTSRPGLLWDPVAEAPSPAPSRVGRLRQMKQLAGEFSVYAVKTAPDYDEGSLWHLRMMARPIYRYAEEAAVDGAIFAFTQGTDPEAFLLLESRHEDAGGRWHFAMAPACVWELHAQRGDHEVWSRPKWNLQDTDKVYSLVGPFAVDPSLFPPELINSTPAPKRKD